MTRITTQPKKNKVALQANKKISGKLVRKSYQNDILEKAPIFPKPLGYADIDKAIFDFVENEIDIVIDGALVPTYTLYSNQRFSEYSQMWEHSDENGNLYLNFKTINREKNPSFGKNQGNLWNIPGNRKYTLLQREVLDDNGTESYEIYTMKQPYAVDLSYSVNFVTTTIDYLNQFNQKINKLFAERQHYIRPNGHYIPMTVDSINDETTYSVSDRKFYVQSITVKAMAYIIDEEDFEVKKYPKRVRLFTENDSVLNKKPKSCVEIEEDNNSVENKTMNVNIQFEPYCFKSEFVFDTDMVIENVVKENIRNFRVMVNDDLYYCEKKFKLHADDNVRIQIRKIEDDKDSLIQFNGYSPNESFNSKEVPLLVKDEPITHEEINVG